MLEKTGIQPLSSLPGRPGALHSRPGLEEAVDSRPRGVFAGCQKKVDPHGNQVFLNLFIKLGPESESMVQKVMTTLQDLRFQFLEVNDEPLLIQRGTRHLDFKFPRVPVNIDARSHVAADRVGEVNIDAFPNGIHGHSVRSTPLAEQTRFPIGSRTPRAVVPTLLSVVASAGNGGFYGGETRCDRSRRLRRAIRAFDCDQGATRRSLCGNSATGRRNKCLSELQRGDPLWKPFSCEPRGGRRLEQGDPGPGHPDSGVLLWPPGKLRSTTGERSSTEDESGAPQPCT